MGPLKARSLQVEKERKGCAVAPKLRVWTQVKNEDRKMMLLFKTKVGKKLSTRWSETGDVRSS